MLIEKTPMVSIIMPVYNAKEYINDAISSILEQSYKNLELIIVDDGSTDGSGLICEGRAKEDERIRLIHEKNHGLCYARNVGLNIAGGGYIAFADHDDIYLGSGIEELICLATETSADLVKGTYIGEIYNESDDKRRYEAKMPDSVLTISELVNQYTIFNYCVRAVWNGLYRAEIIRENSIQFDENLKAGAEDYVFNLEYLRKTVSIGLTKRPIYKHFARKNQSASMGFSVNRQNGIKKAYHIETEFLRNYCISPETCIRQQVHYFYMLVRELSFWNTPLSEKEILMKLKMFVDEIEQPIPIHFIDEILLFKKLPKIVIQWKLLRSKSVGFLYRYHKLKHRYTFTECSLYECDLQSNRGDNEKYNTIS